ncbi:trimethylamine methyltransferase family protein [Mesorhizobium sp. 113-3-3]|uniref:trimethylamine methyltransferase family protein n=1 Tax=Mesorhizobium sp. 113-3-3 TaxID=2744516 RepID=UPI0018ECEF0A|nr:trimethylamine methyltransferase family protein [Mesorhizobium sp. 113-3-3]BCG83289.1 trimethylamine methyltransferase [Mesorhizobium sp. 113-3-3]
MSEPEAPTTRARGRSNRRAAAGGHEAAAVLAGVELRIRPYDLLSEEGLLAIEDAAAVILEEIGIEFREDPESLDLWRSAGGVVQGELVRFPRGMLGPILKTAPSTFTQHARNPARSLKIGGPHVVFAPAYGPPFVRDLEGGRRYGTLGDFENFVKLAYSIPWLHHSGGTVCEPVDIPVNKRHLDMVSAHLRYSDKPFMGSVTSVERAEDSIEMARIVFGREFVDQNCVILANINANSPLVFDATMTGALKVYARANQGAVIVPFILGGAMGPVTTPGAIAQSLAETMVGCALTQLVRRGAPTIFGNFLSSTDLRTGSPTFGTPEPALGSLIVGQLARRLGLPLRCSGAFTSSKVADGQAMMESAVAMQAAVQCGANFILHSAGWLEGGLTMGYEKLILDADFCSALHVYMAGLSVNPNQLALEAFREVGPGKHFFGCAHTIANYRTAFWESEVADNNSFEQWRDAGEKDSLVRANARWKKLLAEYEAPPLDSAIDNALADFCARKKSQHTDQWY